MKNVNYNNNTYFWLKNNNSIIVKKRLLKRNEAIITIFVTTMCIMTPFKFNIFFISACIIIIIFSLLALVWIPTKVNFNEINIIYYPFSLFPMIKKNFTYDEIKDVRFLEKNITRGFSGIGFSDKTPILFLEIINKSFILLKVESKNILPYYNQLVDEIKVKISKMINKV